MQMYRKPTNFSYIIRTLFSLAIESQGLVAHTSAMLGSTTPRRGSVGRPGRRASQNDHVAAMAAASAKASLLLSSTPAENEVTFPVTLMPSVQPSLELTPLPGHVNRVASYGMTPTPPVVATFKMTQRTSTFQMKWMMRNQGKILLVATPHRMFSSASFVYNAWNVWMLLMLIYSILAIAFRVAFLTDLVSTSELRAALLYWHLAEYLLDICWWADMYLKAYKFGFMVYYI